MRKRSFGVAVLVALLCVGLGTSLAAGKTKGAGKPAARAVSQSTVIVNPNPHADLSSFWTASRLKTAKDATLLRKGVLPNSAGSANLDFSRSRIYPQSANKAAPYKGVGKLFFTIPGQGNFQCSASIIAPRVIVTAAHCMYSAGVGFHTNWLFIPAYDGSKATLAAQRPYGTWNWTLGKINPNWINTNGALPNATDWGLLVMQDQSFNGGAAVTVKKKVGFSFTTANGHLFDTAVTMLGYPCNFDSCNIMQRNDSSDHRTPPGTSGTNAYEYGSDMTGGSSGGPWVENLGDPKAAPPSGSAFLTRNAVVAVTSYGYTDASVKILGASQFDSRFTDDLNYVCGAATGNC